MEGGQRSLAEIALAMGFSSQSHFATSFRRATGLTPRQYQEHYSSARRRTHDFAAQVP
jgi:AraC family transcriptional regulator